MPTISLQYFTKRGNSNEFYFSHVSLSHRPVFFLLYIRCSSRSSVSDEHLLGPSMCVRLSAKFLEWFIEGTLWVDGVVIDLMV
jgi:hypothetical protein